MVVEQREQRDLVLSPGESAFTQDTTKGHILTHVGHETITLGGNDVPVIFDKISKRFRQVDISQVKQQFITAPAGWYVELLNPAKDHPKTASKSQLTPTDLQIGKKVVIPGPISFALWPGQMADVIRGHRLRSNEYLVIEIYDDVAAKANWTQATVQTAAAPSGDDAAGSGKKSEDTEKTEIGKEVLAKNLLSSVPIDLAVGKRYIIKGTEIVFYIPPTGVKVVKDSETDKYIRKAVTLEKIEYAVLLDENGDKEFPRGSRVVFPQPTQTFITDKDGKNNKFKGVELDSRKGIHIKVIETYKDGEEEYKEGEEIFISGDGIIYFPRKEHSTIKYGNQEIHFATAIPKGEGRYVLDREHGKVKIVKGELMYLPDPRKEVITRRILTEREVKLFYPGNKEALEVNLALAQQSKSSPGALAAFVAKTALGGELRGLMPGKARPEDKLVGDYFERQTEYTQPRTVILDTKYQGAVPINIWTGYAIKVVDKTGKGRVVVGPDAILLEYDETLEPMQLSTGKPKTTDNLLETAYLMVRGNKVSDIVDALTSDLVAVQVKLSYRVNFEGNDTLKWFSVENYVKFLCDHIRSVLKSVIKKQKVADLYASSTEIIRDTILGKRPETGERSGMKFEENNMRVYDVEVFDLMIGDKNIQALLMDAQQTVIKSNLNLAKKYQEVEANKELEKLSREDMGAKRETEEFKYGIEMDRIEEKFNQSKANSESSYKIVKQAAEDRDTLAADSLKREKARVEDEKLIRVERRGIETADWKAKEEHEKNMIELGLTAYKGHVQSSKEIAQAFTPQIVDALTSLRNADILKTIAPSFANLSILEGKGLMATATRFMDVLPKEFVQKLIDLLPRGSEIKKNIEKLEAEGLKQTD